MTRDYAKRKKTNRSTNKRTPRKTRATKAALSPVWFFLSGMIITLAVIFFWLYSKKPELIKELLPETKSTQQVSSNHKTSQPETTPKELNHKGEDTTFTYHKTLTEKEIEVDSQPVTTASNKTYIMQCGAFRKLEDAESMEAEIAFIGMQANILEKDGWYRVRLGPYSTKRAAESAKHKMQDNNYQDCRIW